MGKIKYKNDADRKKAKSFFAQRWKANNPKRAAATRATYTASIKGCAILLYHSAKAKAKKYKVPFTLTLEHIERGISCTFCPKTGVLFDLSPGKGSKTNPFAPSLDRINAGGSYSDDNVQIVVWFYNWMRGDRDEAQFLYFCVRIVEHAK
jgi:hypothetical protein